MPYELIVGSGIVGLIGFCMLAEYMGWITLQMPPDEPEPNILVVIVEPHQE